MKLLNEAQAYTWAMFLTTALPTGVAKDTA
jgi:hypothetical protein